jgi:hypothetical protein
MFPNQAGPHALGSGHPMVWYAVYAVDVRQDASVGVVDSQWKDVRHHRWWAFAESIL